jgi:hypothetical protein
LVTNRARWLRDDDYDDDDDDDDDYEDNDDDRDAQIKTAGDF